MQYTDLILFDIKQIDNQKHKELTGHNNDNILENFNFIDVI
jgi:pyruvate formate lyase activating enzyme